MTLERCLLEIIKNNTEYLGLLVKKLEEMEVKYTEEEIRKKEKLTGEIEKLLLTYCELKGVTHAVRV